MTMNDLTPNADLAQLAEWINAAHAAAEDSLRAGLQHARATGTLLIEAKAKVAHGQWIPWLEKNVRFSVRTAQAFMRVADRWPELEAKAQGLAHLTFEDGLKLLAAPAEEADKPDRIEDVSRTLDDWRRQWQEAGVWFPAATGRELRRWMSAEPIFESILADAPDEADEFWGELLLVVLIEPAARHLIRTGKNLLPPPSLRPLLSYHDSVVEHNRLVKWKIMIQRAAGGFLNWCEAVGITREKKSVTFPEEPRIEALKTALRAEFLPEKEEGEEISDREMAELLGCAEADLPARLTQWMYGKFYLFMLTKDELAAMAVPAGPP
jgi:hypothetical protein